MIEQQRVKCTLADMSAILEACRQYEALHGFWPSGFLALEDVLPQAKEENLWGDPFVIGSSVDRVWVQTDVPAGFLSRSLNGAQVVVQTLSGKDRVRLSSGRRNGLAARLVYEKRYLYAP